MVVREIGGWGGEEWYPISLVPANAGIVPIHKNHVDAGTVPILESCVDAGTIHVHVDMLTGVRIPQRSGGPATLLWML